MEDDDHQQRADELRPDEHTRRARWRSLLNFTTRDHVTTLAIALAFSVVSGIVVPAVSIFMGKIFNQFTEFGGGKLSGHDLIHRVAINCIALTAIGASSCLLNGGYFMFWLVFGELQAKSVRDKLFDGLMQKDMEWYDLRKDGVGALISRLQSQTRELQIATSQPLGLVIQYAVTALASLGVAFYNSWNVTLVTLATFPIAVAVLSYTSARIQPAIDAQETSLSEAAKISTSALSAIEVVKSFNGQEGEIRRYVEKIMMAAKAYYRQAHANAFQIGIFRLVIRGMFVQGFWYGSSLVGHHKMTSGQVLTTFWAALMATQAIEQMLPQLIVLEKGRAAGAALQAVRLRVERGRRITEMVGRQVPAECQGDIDIRGLTFSYPARPDLPAIENASFLFAAGETTFVIGGSGSGKSTLGNLIMRYYSSWSGSISIDDNAIQTLDLGWLRRNVTLVQQQSMLFNETLFRNIAFGRQDHDRVSKDEIRDACQVALLQHTINDLPDGLDTVVAPGGFSMSGGQRQRVAIARAKLRDTPILILDESTSALDYISRSLVMDAIREWRKGKTTVIITHDVSQIYEDEFVYVMDKGKVLQEGYKAALEKDTAGLFYSFLQSAKDPIKPDDTTGDHFHVYQAKHRKTGRSKSDGAVLSTKPGPSDSVDSLDIQFPHNVQYIPTIFGGSATDLRNRRPSQNQLSPLTPLSSALSPRLRTPLGMELVEFSGRRTRQRHVDVLQRTPRTAHPLGATRPLSSAPMTRPSRMGRRKREQRQPQIASLKEILATIWPNLDTIGRTRLVLGFFSAFVHAAATPTFSFLFAKLLATFFHSTPGRNRESTRWSLAMLGVSLGDAIASYLMYYLLEICAQAWIDRLRTQAYRRMLDQPRIWFDKDRNSVSRLSECLDGNAEEMRNLVGRFAGFAFVAASMTTMAIIWSFVICWKLTIVGVAAAPLMYAVTRGFEYVSGKWEGESHDASEAAGAIFMETFSNVKLVRALTLETYFRNKYGKATRQTLSVGLRRSAYSGLFYGLSESGILFVTALIFYYGAVLVSSQLFTTANILAVFTMLTFSIANANSIVSFIPQINSSRDTATRLLRLAYLPSTSREESGSIRLDTPLPICIHNLSFAYPSRPGQFVLDEVNLEIRPNSSLAVVGSSGSGKSTLASLVLGLYPVSFSSPSMTGDRRHHDSFGHDFPLTYAGHALPNLSLSSLRSQIAIVPQVPVLFPTTIAANIGYGCQSEDVGTMSTRSPSAARAAIVRAAKRAGIHDFIISLPRSYDTVIGDGGQGLSGGQAQRLAIARALVRNPKLLILDEATSSLDAENARLIRDTVQGLVVVVSSSSPSSMGLAGKHGQEDDGRRDDGRQDDDEGMSVLIITHAKEMMQVAEFIIVLDRGRVVESGTWEYLTSFHPSTTTTAAAAAAAATTTTSITTAAAAAKDKINRDGASSSSSPSSPPPPPPLGLVSKRTGALLELISGGEWQWPVNVNSHHGHDNDDDGGDGGDNSKGRGRMNFGDVRWK